MDLGTKLKVLRAINGLNQKQLAEKSGVCDNAIARIESKNQTYKPSVRTLVSLSKALNVDVKELLDCER